MVEPTSKKRKLEPGQGLVKQDSFSAVLQQLEAEEDASGDSIETSAAWPRPAVPPINIKQDSIGRCARLRTLLTKIVFQQIEIEESVDATHGPTLRLFGVTQHGNSVLAHIHGFKPYFYIAAPSGFLNKDLEPLKDTINNLPKVKDEGQIDFNNLFPPEILTYESNIAYTLRFMIDTKLIVSYKDLISHAPEGEWLKIAPLRTLSFDIECAGRKGIFPEANIDPVIQIAAMVTRHGESKPFVRNVFTLNTCAHIVGSQVIEFQDERQMLQEWRKFVEKADPDVIIGYNTSNFDLPYLLDRAKALKIPDFAFLGRVRTEVKETHFSSKAYGQRDSKAVNMEGRLQLDMLQVMQRDYKLRSYTLNAVCAQFLGEQKEDVHHSIITELQNGTADSRRRLAVYCLKLYRNAADAGYIIPAMKGEGTDEQYEGATVIEPTKGFYDVPIATLDFASLYPSIMMAHNLCYTTLLDKVTIERLKLVEEEDYVHTPNNAGLEGMFLSATSANPFQVSANSVYGFTGATVGKLPCLAISSSVTAYGRQMIEFTKGEVEAEYSTKNGYDHDAKVIYGDTDSVMVKFGCPDLPTAMRLVSGKFVKPIKLEFEKVYFPYLLISKKRYAGLYWTKPEKYDKMDTKGIETVRRDNCRLVSTVIETCLFKMLIDRDVKGAEDGLRGETSACRACREDEEERCSLGDRVAYVIIKGTKGAAAYEKSEDPLYVLEHNVPIDTRYYLDNQLSKPLMRIFEPILGEKAGTLLAGDHTRTIQIATPTIGGLMKFAVKTVTCLGCKTPLRSNKDFIIADRLCAPLDAMSEVSGIVTSAQLDRFDKEIVW
ncbi:DNA polymerase delta catalytic subunit [Kwoniella shandongensis]|uniref:DNA polymerase n=1 Tax=Kwoniella shandongensis TaxID=1734106 RepID=A0AAJ8LR19_9TREE